MSSFRCVRMAEHPQSPDDLYSFAEALVYQMVGKYQLTWNSHGREDAVQDLCLAGWQVWCDTGG